MKFTIFFLLCCLALTSAAPHIISAWPGIITPYTTGLVGSRTVVAGPTVVDGIGARIVAPGYIGTTII